MNLVTRKFSVAEYHLMIESGVFTQDDRLELIEGEIIKMSPVGFKHAATVKKLNYLFAEKLGKQAIIGVQDPIVLNDNSEPQPDLVILKPREDFYATAHPQPKDILLLIEVADSTINFDRQVKLPLYARNKIAEVWIVDLNDRYLEIYRNPQDNYYQNMQKMSSKDNINLHNFSSININVAELLI